MSAQVIKTYCDVAGWLGTAGFMGFFLLLSLGLIGPGRLFFGVGIVESLLIVLHSWERRSWQMFWLNVVGAGFNAIGLVRHL